MRRVKTAWIVVMLMAVTAMAQDATEKTDQPAAEQKAEAQPQAAFPTPEGEGGLSVSAQGVLVELRAHP